MTRVALRIIVQALIVLFSSVRSRCHMGRIIARLTSAKHLHTHQVFVLIILIVSVNFSFCAQVHAQSYGTLKIKWVGVIDNGEGDDWPHGPYGSLHILIYPVSVRCPGDQKSYDGYWNHVYLTGPSKGEWLDGDSRTMDLSVWNWRHSSEEIIIVIYESDPGGVGRSHDMLFCAQVSISSTANSLTILHDTYRINKNMK